MLVHDVSFEHVGWRMSVTAAAPKMQHLAHASHSSFHVALSRSKLNAALEAEAAREQHLALPARAALTRQDATENTDGRNVKGGGRRPIDTGTRIRERERDERGGEGTDTVGSTGPRIHRRRRRASCRGSVCGWTYRSYHPRTRRSHALSTFDDSPRAAGSWQGDGAIPDAARHNHADTTRAACGQHLLRKHEAAVIENTLIRLAQARIQGLICRMRRRVAARYHKGNA